MGKGETENPPNGGKGKKELESLDKEQRKRKKKLEKRNLVK